MDAGHDEIDSIINLMERDVKELYDVAAADLQDKVSDYWRRYDLKNDVKSAQLQAGEITAEQYTQWRTGQLLIGQRWEEQLNVITRDLLNAHNIAESIVHGYLPDVFALSYNYGNFEVDALIRGVTNGALNSTKFGLSYTLYDRDTVIRLMRDKPEILPPLNPRSEMARKIAEGKVIQWEKKQVTSELLQGIVQGESNVQIAQRMRSITNADWKSVMRYARTATTGAETAGRLEAYQRAEEAGIQLEKQWLATLDMRTRHSHRMLDGEHVPTNKPFSNGCMRPGDPNGAPSEIWNCFVGETNVSFDSEVQKSYKHKYKGELVTVKSAAGVNFTCTPNHPILTTKGWVAAGKLHQGDNLVVTQVGRGAPAPRVKPDINHSFPSFRALHKFLNMVFTQRATGLSVDFHGDVATANVEVVSKERFLGSNVNPRCNKPIDEIGFKNSDSFVSGKCHFMPRLRGINISLFSLVRSACKSLSFFLRGLRHSKEHRFRAIARNDVSIAKYSINNLPATTEIRSELLNGLSGKVFIDHVISIDVKAGSTHVYNLQTQNGYYFVNTIIPQSKQMCNNIMAIAKNCRCTLITMLTGIPEIDEEGSNDLSNIQYRNTDNLSGMEYSEWKKGNSKSDPIMKAKRIGDARRAAAIREYRAAAERLGVNHNG